ncbi:hypothetical protein J2T17_004167 [Paenibacillus mucilaginosus]|uniref:hypothetical protein n=1 Tax=Paenibacillus mucilaginosus TaxID=61624 RepID=UPI003D20EF54
MPTLLFRTAVLAAVAAAVFLSAALPSSPPLARAASIRDGAFVPPVQIYAPALDQVVRTLPNTRDIRRSAETWLAAAGGLSPRLRIQEESRLVLRIPMHPPLPVSKARLIFHCRELFLLVPLPETKENPQLLAFSTGDGTYIFECTWETLRPFWKEYGLEDLSYH